MSRDYISDRSHLVGPVAGTGEEDVQLQDLQDFIVGDTEYLYFGDDRDVKMNWDGSALEFLPITNDTGAIHIGDGTADIDFKIFLGQTTKYMLADVGDSRVELYESRSSQAVDSNLLYFDVTTDSSFISGDNMLWSSSYGVAPLKISATYSGLGGFSGILNFITTTGEQVTDGHGVVGLKTVVTNTSAITAGVIYAGQFIAKHASTGTMLAAPYSSLIGLEAWAYISSSGPARTAMGGNFGFHNECSGAYGDGSVIRGVQIFCDNASGAQVPVESTGLCIWNQAGTITNAINVVCSGSGFTYFLSITDNSGVPADASSSTVANIGTSGWLKCEVGAGVVRYIPLGDGVT